MGGREGGWFRERKREKERWKKERKRLGLAFIWVKGEDLEFVGLLLIGVFKT